MNRAEALKIARANVTIHGTTGNYAMVGPWQPSQLQGPRTEVHVTGSYHDAQRSRREWVAEIAFCAMFPNIKPEPVSPHMCDTHTDRQLLDIIIQWSV